MDHILERADRADVAGPGHDAGVQRDPAVAGWSDTTKAKLLQVVLRILAEARYLESTRSLHLTPPLLHPEAQRYLKFRSEAAVLAALELTH